jgi:hypothetical protein
MCTTTYRKEKLAICNQSNKGRRQVIFEPGDWILGAYEKGRRVSKLHPRGGGSFQVLARINNNAYKLDLPGEYNISATFNVYDLSPLMSGMIRGRILLKSGGMMRIKSIIKGSVACSSWAYYLNKIQDDQRSTKWADSRDLGWFKNGAIKLEPKGR